MYSFILYRYFLRHQLSEVGLDFFPFPVPHGDTTDRLFAFRIKAPHLWRVLAGVIYEYSTDIQRNLFQIMIIYVIYDTFTSEFYLSQRIIFWNNIILKILSTCWNSVPDFFPYTWNKDNNIPGCRQSLSSWPQRASPGRLWTWPPPTGPLRRRGASTGRAGSFTCWRSVWTMCGSTAALW